MRVGILSRNRYLYSTRRLIEACRQFGHEPIVIDTVRAAIQLKLSPDLHRNNPHLPQLDGIIPRVGASVTKYGLRLVSYFEERQIPTAASAAGIASSRDKLISYQTFVAAGIPTPTTRIIHHPNKLWAAILSLGGLPVVIKRRRSAQGRGVMLLRQNSTVNILARAMKRANPPIVLLGQPFIPEAEGKDIRIIVVGGRCVAAMERTASPGDFRSNLHRGGSAVPIQPTPEMKRLALAAAEALSLQVGGVDLIRSKEGLLALEANSSPGLEGIETSTGIDVAGAIVAYLTSQMKGDEAAWQSYQVSRYQQAGREALILPGVGSIQS